MNEELIGAFMKRGDSNKELTAYEGHSLAQPEEELIDQGLLFDLATMLSRRHMLRAVGLGAVVFGLTASGDDSSDQRHQTLVSTSGESSLGTFAVCQEAPGLVVEKNRLLGFGASFLGIIGDSSHSFGYHMCSPSAGDYSLLGAVNRPVGNYSCAIDIGMNWSASRQWLAWLITEIREDRITDIAEVIGSFNGRDVRYWSDDTGWQQSGVAYQGAGHDSWTHVAIYRSTAQQDHRILAGWTAGGYDSNQEGIMVAFDENSPVFGNGKESVYSVYRILLSILDGRATVDNLYWRGATSVQSNTLHAKLDQLLSRPSVTLNDAQMDAIAQRVADVLAARMRA